VIFSLHRICGKSRGNRCENLGKPRNHDSRSDLHNALGEHINLLGLKQIREIRLRRPAATPDVAPIKAALDVALIQEVERGPDFTSP
jgi:hypothetical protein